MRLSRQGYEGRTDRIRDLSQPRNRMDECCPPHCRSRAEQSASRRSSPAENGAIFIDHSSPHAPQRALSESGRHTDQEQIQIIATAIGTPKPSAPKIARTNSESRFAWCRTPGVDMTLLLGAPRASTRPQDERSICAFGPKPVATLQWGNAGAVMVNKWLIDTKRAWQTAP